MKLFFTKMFFLILLLFLFSCNTPENIEVHADVPISINRGELFTITTQIKNTSHKPQELVSIDIANNYLDGVVILGTSPNYKDVINVPIDNTTSYSFNKIINPNSEITVKFNAKAVNSGIYNSTIDFCINSSFNFISRTIFTEIN